MSYFIYLIKVIAVTLMGYVFTPSNGADTDVTDTDSQSIIDTKVGGNSCWEDA